MLGIPKVEVEDKINYGQILGMAVSVISILTVGTAFIVMQTKMQERVEVHETSLREQRLELRQLALQQVAAAERQASTAQTLNELRDGQARFAQSVAIVREDVASIKGLLRQQQDRHAPN